ncbi:hypothetical protein HD597_004024 [Nonomuraea thailandensis]|uniref:DUF4129 domain-containing protein n=1 Tax=Nonomuraea thailandensis TaxID=1188745 RepID=A0A9X2GGE0_9ACTN|nr:hypothetical protein [Nonomuraea thailandensis]MCP2357004.1 hypothetical protein [Nonomuraea thailandensis]
MAGLLAKLMGTCLAVLVTSLTMPLQAEAVTAPLRVSPEEFDSRVAYCLSEDRRDELVEAANNLKVGTPIPVPSPPHPSPTDTRIRIGDKEFGLEDWPTGNSIAFKRVCGALIRTDPDQRLPSSSFWSGLFGGMIPVIIGGLLTLFAATRTLRRDRIAQVGTELRAAAIAYRRAATQHIAAQTDPTKNSRDEDGELASTQMALEGQLWAIRGLRLHGAALADELLQRLTAEGHAPWGKPAEWRAEGQKNRLEEFKKERTKAVEREVQVAFDVVLACERALPRPHWLMRRKRISDGRS